jgi:phytoene dehydrogenase-like protein
MSDYSARFRDPLLREAFNYVLYERHPAFPVLPYYFQLAMHANGSAGVPEGGSLGLARSIEQRLHGLGGRISYNTKVERVLIEDDRAVGVRLTTGEELRADIVISACDGHTAVMDLVGGAYLTDEYRRMYTETINEQGMTFPGFVVLFLGLRHEIPGAEPCTTVLLDEDEAARLVGIHHPSVNVQFRSMHYPELAGPGKSILYAAYFCDVEPWRRLNDGMTAQATRVRGGQRLHTLPVRHGKAYYAAKHSVRDAMLQLLERRLPGINDAIAVRDLSTPLTHIRYTGNYNGTVLGWMPFADSGETVQGEVKKHGPVLPGLANFYMSGVWTTTGGLIRAAASGRHVMQYVCRDDGRPFTASVDHTLPPPTHRLLPVGPSQVVPARTTDGRVSERAGT